MRPTTAPEEDRIVVPLEERLNYRFYRHELLDLALRHESYANEEGDPNVSNERIEFLGDSVLGLVVCDFLYHQFPGETEGRLAQMKAQLVSTEQLAQQGRLLQLGDEVQLGRGEQYQGRDRNNLLADTFEAIVGAIYLDRGFAAAEAFLLHQMGESLRNALELRNDYKTSLQETTQKEYHQLPEYVVVSEEGPSHEKIFQVEVRLHGRMLGTGCGRSKREAGQRAAEQALDRLTMDTEWVQQLRESMQEQDETTILEDIGEG